MTRSLIDRLDALKAEGVIAGWQAGGGSNYGLSLAPLPWLIFPLNERPATSYYRAEELERDVTALERFGPIHLSGRRGPAPGSARR
jgi:hypothetical protein